MKRLVLTIFFLCVAQMGFAKEQGQQAANQVLTAQQITAMLEARFPQAHVESVELAEMNALYYVFIDGQIFYISLDGKYLFKGNMFDISEQQVRNLSNEKTAELERLKSPMRKEEIAKLDEKSMVIFKAPHEKHVITVFTDIDCGVCRKLHRERQEFLDRGITLRYLAFPRAGLLSASADKLMGIWCSSDPLTAMTDAKIHGKYLTGSCEAPLEEHMKLVKKFGLGGTPSIILGNGDLIAGYLPAQEIEKQLEALASTNSVTSSK